MNRPALIVILLWAVIAAPALCLAGVLAHECPCEEAEAACDHELDCDSDPCSELVFRKDETAPAPDSGPAPIALLPRADWMRIRSAAPVPAARAAEVPPGLPPSLDLPLLN